MANNNFKPFAAAAGANVMAQADYEALAALLTGFQSGTAQSVQLNKVWRQSSIMAAVLGQFIVDLTGQDAVDDGTTATLLANLKMAVQAQSAAVVGQARNLSMSVTTAASTATLNADEIVVGTALGGQKYLLKQFSKTINLAAAGAGGMDTGAAPASGFVALYAIYNPTTGASALLATNATASIAPNVYGGANMPPGYSASALVSVWPTDGSGRLVAGFQRDREIFGSYGTILTTSVQQASLTPLSISAFVPPNAKTMSGDGSISSTSAGSGDLFLAGAVGSNIGLKHITQAALTANISQIGVYSYIPIIEQQKIYYKATVSAGTMTASIYISSYTF
ncbi:hypothetical protein QZM42_33720 [Burkholderia vietnamiensis]|uniref:hypothetical protein n=1 Tax=Burkholderia vietnamiensis TaxID=60552 RepID=UPI0026549277|nr:hypothetical protein [Burkholderia vietnamiensis]MDN7413487.1 hypothetical protein [Burkholderia vietnamiensis]